MAPHSSTLAWKIPWMDEPGGLQSMGSLRVGSGLHERGNGERVIVLESWEGTRASRRVEEGLTRSFSEIGRAHV